jgi:hypothetical protein
MGRANFSSDENGRLAGFVHQERTSGALMDWSMRDESFKTQLFRFVDVLPTLTSSGEASRHLKEYLDPDVVRFSPALRTALKSATGASWLFGPGGKSPGGVARAAVRARQYRAVKS